MKNKHILLRLVNSMGDHFSLYLAGVFAGGLVLTFRQIFIAWVLKDLFDYAAAGNFSKLLLTTIVGILVILVLSITRPIFRYWGDKATFLAVADLKKALFLKIAHLPMGYFGKEHTGNLISKLTNDMREVEQVLVNHMYNLVGFFVCGATAMLAMFFLDFWLAIIALGTGVIALAINAYLAKPLKVVGEEVQSSLGHLTERLSDLLAGAKVTKAFNLYERMGEKFGQANQGVYQSSMKRVKIGALLASLNDFGKMIDLIGVMGIGSYFALTGRVSVGEVIAMWQLKTPVLAIFREIGNVVTGLQTGVAASERVFQLMDEPEEPKVYSSQETLTSQKRDLINQAPEVSVQHLDLSSQDKGAHAYQSSISKNPPVEGVTVRLQDVNFGYTPDQFVLRKVSLQVQKGEKVILVGPSGEGKSTIFKLLMGFYPPASGRIDIEGQSFGHSELSELRKKIAYVPQSAYLFSGTLMENIRYARPDATNEEVVLAARLANAHDFIMNFENGYETRVGERGSLLSGGQRQRIGIARAILKNAPILLLDEVTSALDAESECLVQEALDRLAEEKTVLMITHRFSMIKPTDRICVIAAGQVAEEGTHTQLMANRHGIYRSLYEKQCQTLEGVV